MLFVASAPIQVQVLEDRKVIVLTNNKIMFCHLDFIEEYLSMPLITVRPKKMCYQSEVMQVMVVSNTTIQIYYCDWKTQIKLLRVIILNNETVDSIWYEQKSGWHIFGTMAQYEPTRVNFHKTDDKQPNYIAKCFIGPNKYVLTKTQFLKSQYGDTQKQVNWKDKMMVLKNCNLQIKMTGAETLDKKRNVICINQTYILIISRFEVVGMIIQPVVAFYQNDLLISHVQKGKLTTLQKLQNNNYSEIGTINRENGNICGAFLYEDDILVLQYDKKQIHLNSMPLISEVDNTQFSKKSEKKKKLFQSISRIMEQSHQEGSQFFPREEKGPVRFYSLQGLNKSQTHYYPNEKPIIKHITVQDDDQINSNTLNESDSEVLSRSGIDPAQKISQVYDQSRQNKEQEHIFEALVQQNDLKDKFKSQSVSHPKNNYLYNNFLISSQTKQPKKRKNSKNFEVNDTNQQKSRPSYKRNQKIDQNPANKHQSIHNVSCQNHSYQDNAETPPFDFDVVLVAEKQGEYDKQQNEAPQYEINKVQQYQMQQSVCIDYQKSVLKFMPQKISKKVQVFKPKNAILTTQLYNKIEKTSFCSLISKAMQEDPDRIQQLLDLFLPNVLEQAEAPLFFQKNIKTFNPQFTRDKIRTLFGSIINNKQFKLKMTNAFQLFKLSEVPKQILNFPQDFIKILSIICRQVYIQDLIKPAQATVQYILNFYFNIQKFNEEMVTIQDEQIDITHPRNMLNILLYLNQTLNLKIDCIIKVYCTKLIQQNQFQILKKITQKQNIFQICQVPRSVLDEVIITKFNQLLNQQVQNYDYLWCVIQFLSKPLLDQYRIILAIINQFNKCNIIFQLSTFIQIKSQHNDIYIFLQKIIYENYVRNLINLKIGSIYRSLYWLQEGQKILNVTNQYVELVKSLADKFCDKKYIYHAFLILDTVLPKIKISFIAKLLMNYLGGKFINRIAEHQNIRGLQNLFPELTTSPEVDPDALPHDNIKIPQFSNSLSCSWTKFNSILQKYLDVPLQVKVLIFCQINIANQLFLTLDENMKKKFIKFLAEIQQNIIIELDNIYLNDDSVNPKGITSIEFEDYPKYDLQSEAPTSTLNGQYALLLHDDQKQAQKKIVYKSMTLIDHYNDLHPQKLLVRHNSDTKDIANNEQNEDLVRIKLLVNKKQIIDQLNEIYTTKKQQIFMRSLKYVDQEKIQFYHMDVFKAIVYKQIQYPLSTILPFEIFLTSDTAAAFQLAREKITGQLNFKNFWIIFVVIQLIFKMGAEVVYIFLKKCIVYFRNDSYFQILSTILNVTKPKLNKIYIKNMIDQANGYGLVRIKHLLTQYNKIKY